jgi:hypothetical protein
VKKYILAWFAGIHWGYVMNSGSLGIVWTKNRSKALLFNKYTEAEGMQQSLNKIHPASKFEIEEIEKYHAKR